MMARWPLAKLRAKTAKNRKTKLASRQKPGGAARVAPLSFAYNQAKLDTMNKTRIEYLISLLQKSGEIEPHEAVTIFVAVKELAKSNDLDVGTAWIRTANLLTEES